VSAGRRFAPAQRSCGGPHGVPSGARRTRALREPGERAGESPLLHGLAISSSTARAAPSPQRERRTAPPSTTARQVPTCARRFVAPSPLRRRARTGLRRARLRARARESFVAEVGMRLHGGGVSGWSTPRPRRRDHRGRARRRGAGTRVSHPVWGRTPRLASHAARDMPGRFFGSRASHRFGS
jgi:hypothetical protein